jgi:hypothetical protein
LVDKGLVWSVACILAATLILLILCLFYFNPDPAG